MLLPIAILLLPFCLFFSELTCANIIIDKWDMSYKLTFHLFLFCKRIRTKYKASAHCRNGDEYGAFFDAENRVMTWKMKQEEIAWHMNMATIAHLKLTSRISENLKKVFERIGIGSKDDFGNPYEEWFISDYDCYVDGLYEMLGEYESLDELNYLAFFKKKPVIFFMKNKFCWG